MAQHPIVAAVTTLSVAAPAGCDRVALAELASLSLQVRAWLDSFDATLATCDPTVVDGEGRRSSREARAVAGRAEVRAAIVEQASALVDTAAVSSVDWFERHVRDLARRLADDDGLRQSERVRRQRFLRRWTARDSGLCHTHVALDPEADARLSATLDAAVAAERATPDGEARTFDQLRADAFVAAVTAPRAGGRRP